MSQDVRHDVLKEWPLGDRLVDNLLGDRLIRLHETCGMELVHNLPCFRGPDTYLHASMLVVSDGVGLAAKNINRVPETRSTSG
jgi:urocanate hydratase